MQGRPAGEHLRHPGSALFRIAKGGAKKDAKGSGSATVQKSGAGGTFTIDASTASGEKITGKIQCGRFGSIHAEGG